MATRRTRSRRWSSGGTRAGIGAGITGPAEAAVGHDGAGDPSSHARAAPDAVDRSPAAEQERRERVLTQGKPSVTRSIAEAVVIKDGDLFFLSEPDARV